MYRYTDKIIRALNRKIVRRFSNSKRLIRQDELNVIEGSKKLYKALTDDAEEGLLLIAEDAYREASRRGAMLLGTTVSEKLPRRKAWLDEQLDAYGPITGYVFAHEIARKRARFAESVIAQKSTEAVDRSRDLWAGQVAQYAIEITDSSALQAYRDAGIKYVKWNTEMDSRVCKTCKARSGKIYPIDAVPEKPHYHCRCYFTPAEKPVKNASGREAGQKRK